MAITLNLEPDPEGTEMAPNKCTFELHRGVTRSGLPAVLILDEVGAACAVVSLRELVTATRGLVARAETWPEWQSADTPPAPDGLR